MIQVMVMDMAIFAAYVGANQLNCRPQHDMLPITELPCLLLLMYINGLLLLWEGIQTMITVILNNRIPDKKDENRNFTLGKKAPAPNPDVLVYQTKLSLQ